MLDRTFCATASLELAEPLAGTAAEADIWVILELREPWACDPFEQAESLGPAVQRHLAGFLERFPRARFQVICHERRCSGPLTFVFGRSAGSAPALYEWALDGYDGLLDLDLDELAANGGPAGNLRKEPLFLVCTHGKRDRCCAKWGLPVYQALRARFGDHVWQTSHLGGHRFAPTMLALPHGYCWGRIEAPEAGEVVASYRRDRAVAHPDLLRGRTCFDRPAQAAEVALLVSADSPTAGGLSLTSLAPSGAGWLARFAGPGGGDVQIDVRPIEGQRPPSCGKVAEPVTVLETARR